MTANAETIFRAALAADAAGATDWPSMRAAMIRALNGAASADELPLLARQAAEPSRLGLIEMRDAIICEIARSARYRGKGKRACAEAIAGDLRDYQTSRFHSDDLTPQYDPDRGFHRIISNGSALIGGSGRTLGWNAVYKIITSE